LAIAGLGNKMSKASNYLIMMIMGGGVVSVLQGKLASESLLGILNSYWVGVACFAYLAYYAVSMTAHFKKEGIEVGQASGGH
jgi:FHS family L-fucose permease-like MFS transporter